MARLNKTLLENISGGIGRQLVFKQYGDKTVVTAYQDMSKVKRSEGQKANQNVFGEAGGLCQGHYPEPGKES